MSSLVAREIIPILIAGKYTDEEIVDHFGTRPIVVDKFPEDWKSGPTPEGVEVLCLTESPARRRLLEIVREIRGIASDAKRPRLIPDPEGAIRQAIKVLRGRQTRLTFENVATWMRDEIEGCESLSEKTLRTWRAEEGWPPFTDAWWTVG